MELHLNLNKDQLKIVRETQGVIRVISGPGTGKSTTCVHYIAELINSQKARGEDILAVTFTNKAAKELKSRVAKIVGSSPTVSTIHSFCAAILRKHPPLGYSENFTILDEGGQFISIGHLVRRLNLGIHPRVILEKMTLARNLRDMSILETEGLEEFYKIYMVDLMERDIIDYDGLLIWCLWVFEKYPQVLQAISDRYKYILVDEFQDISPIQLDIIKLLINSHRNLMVVGDPDQSIYRFRGSDVSIMVNLDKIFPRIKTFYLNQNYRSSENIIKAAVNLINNNKKARLAKSLWTKRGKGESVEVLDFATETDEVEYIAAYIKEKVSQGSKYEDFAILYRVNILGIEFETTFSKLDIPYEILGGISFYQSTEIKNILAFFKLAADPTDNASFLKACSILAQVKGLTIRNFQKRYYQEKDLALIDIAYLAEENFIRELPDFINQLSKEERLAKIYERVLDKTKYLEYLKKDNSTVGVQRVENIEELKSIVLKMQESGKNLRDFLELVDRIGLENKEDSVKLMTIHGAKGLEFNTVFIVGAVKGMYPHFRSEEEEELEEERRLFYVAVTRAKDKLYITYPNSILVKGERVKKKPSIYIDELKLPKKSFNTQETNLSRDALSKDTFVGDIPQLKRVASDRGVSPLLKAGSIVYHPKFGKGYVVNITGQFPQTIVAIDFSKEIKTLILEYAPLSLWK